MTEEVDVSIKEVKVSDWPGWIRRTMGNTRRYVSPGGTEISNARFYELQKKYAGQSFIPESDVLPPPRKSSGGFFQSDGSKSSPPPQKKNQDVSEDKIHWEEDVNVLGVPEPKSRPGKPSGGRASARELAAAAQTTLIIVTSIVALLLNWEDVSMTEMEAKAISIPFGNIFESTELNEKFGRIMASSGDYQMLGYALYLYGHRVMHAFKVRKGMMGNAKPQTTSSQNGKSEPAVGAGAGIYNGVYSANLPFSRTSGSWNSSINGSR